MRRRVLALIDIPIIFWQHIDVMEYYTVESVLERVWRPVGLKKYEKKKYIFGDFLRLRRTITPELLSQFFDS